MYYMFKKHSYNFDKTCYPVLVKLSRIIGIGAYLYCYANIIIF